MLEAASHPMRSFKIQPGYFLIVPLLLFLFETAKILKGEWGGDFWTHAAVVNELMRDPLHPQNPILNSTVPHAFFSPYSLLVALVARFTATGPVTALEYFAFFNLVLFLFLFYFFCKNIFKEDHRVASVIGLILVLFYWGFAPYGWSGFYHFYVLHNVLPYPSTFAMSICLLALSGVAKQRLGYAGRIIIVFAIAVVILTHPTTAIFLFTGIFALHCSYHRRTIKKSLLNTAAIILPAMLLCFAWPYYGVIDLWFGNNKDFHNDSIQLYHLVMEKCWPAFLTLPALFITPRNKVSDFFLLCILINLAIYCGGYIFKLYGLSRGIASLMFLCQLQIAYTAARLIKNPVRPKSYFLLVILCTLSIAIYLNRSFMGLALDLFRPSHNSTSRYLFLQSRVRPGRLVFSDPISNLRIPVFGGKVVATTQPLYWVDDIDERRKDVIAFFDTTTTDSIRMQILKKYKPDYILVDHRSVRLQDQTLMQIRALGKTIYVHDSMELLRIETRPAQAN